MGCVIALLAIDAHSGKHILPPESQIEFGPMKPIATAMYTAERQGRRNRSGNRQAQTLTVALSESTQQTGEEAGSMSGSHAAEKAVEDPVRLTASSPVAAAEVIGAVHRSAEMEEIQRLAVYWGVFPGPATAVERAESKCNSRDLRGVPICPRNFSPSV
jgi:hypothetical protein